MDGQTIGLIVMGVYLAGMFGLVVWGVRLSWKTARHNKRMRDAGLHHYTVGPF